MRMTRVRWSGGLVLLAVALMGFYILDRQPRNWFWDSVSFLWLACAVVFWVLRLRDLARWLRPEARQARRRQAFASRRPARMPTVYLDADGNRIDPPTADVG